MSMPERITPRPVNIARAAPTAKCVTMETTKATHAAAKDTLAENILKDTFIPLHPGAARYYAEIGVEIPAAIAPGAE